MNLDINVIPVLRKQPSHRHGGGDFGWLKTAHTFSFGNWHDPRWMRFGDLRVINEDRIAPAAVAHFLVFDLRKGV